MAEPSKNPPETERSRRYREFARETLKLAEDSSKPELKATYLSLSSCWANLAHEAENSALRDSAVRQVVDEQPDAAA